MNQRFNMNQIFWGVAVILVGFIFLIQNLGLVPGMNFWRYLPILLVFLGLYQLVVNQFRAWIGPVILILVGSLLTLATMEIIRWATFGSLIWPIILIIVGLNIILRRSDASSSFSEKFDISEERDFNFFTAFSGLKKKITSQDFKNGEMTVMFGGVELDFHDAQINQTPAGIQTTVMFGGAEIFVPADWDVRNNVVAIFGGVDNKRRETPVKDTPDLVISGTVLFGGLDIR